MSSAESFRPHYTVADYQHWSGDWELWDGCPIAMSPSPFGRHQGLAFKIARRFADAIDRAGCRAEVLTEIDWIVSSDTVVRPDVVVLCGGLPERHVESPPAIVVEVASPSTEKNDRTYKLALFEREGVSHTFLVGLDGQVSWHRMNPSGRYQVSPVAGEINLSICDDCELTVDLPDESSGT